jgi:hypothetical protein
MGPNIVLSFTALRLIQTYLSRKRAKKTPNVFGDHIFREKIRDILWGRWNGATYLDAGN